MPTEPATTNGSADVILRGRSLLVVAVAIVVIGWLARPILGPFIVAAVVAYAVSPVVSAVQGRTGLRRAAVVGIAYLAGFLVIGALG
ncbi:MAG: hypothetical protein ACHQNA_14535, partial [Acidimicrobiales bacterium]